MTLLSDLLDEAEGVLNDAERWSVIERAWLAYCEKGAGWLDWDYDSRLLMAALKPEVEYVPPADEEGF